MKKNILLLFSLLFLAVNVKGDDLDKLQVLNQEKRELKLKMHKKRKELIEKDSSLKELQKKIMALHKELAIRVDNNEEMRELVSKLREIETQIKSIEENESKNDDENE